MTEKWRTISTRITIDDYNHLMKIAKKEGKTESDTLRLAVQMLFEAYPRFDMLKELFLSEAFKKSMPILQSEFAPVLAKAFESIAKEWNQAVSKNPKLKEVEKMFKEFKRTTKPIELKDIKEPGKIGRPKGSSNIKKKDSLTVELMRHGLTKSGKYI